MEQHTHTPNTRKDNRGPNNHIHIFSGALLYLFIYPATLFKLLRSLHRALVATPIEPPYRALRGNPILSMLQAVKPKKQKPYHDLDQLRSVVFAESEP